PELIHCQRDVWMLLPLAAAARLRCGPFSVRRSMAEGALWMSALWIKPFAIVPAIVCVGVSAAVPERRRTVGADVAALAAGGGAVAAAGVAALGVGGSWPAFQDVLVNWNPDYVMRTYDLVTRRRLLEHWMKDAAPASYAVIAATVVATAGLLRALRRPLTDA